MGNSFPIMNRSCPNGNGISRSPSPEPSLPDNSPTLPRSPADADSADQLANQLERARLSTPPPSAPVPIALPSPVGSTITDFEEEGHRRASRPGTPCRSCGDRYLCPTCGLCGRCGREYAPSPEPEPTPELTPEDSNASTFSGLWSMSSFGNGGVQPRRMLEVTVRGRDVINAAVAGSALGRQFMLSANGVNLLSVDQLRRVGDYFAGVWPNSSDEVPAGTHYSCNGQTAIFRFEIEERDLTGGTAVGYHMAQWAQAALGGMWEHSVAVIQSSEDRSGSA